MSNLYCSPKHSGNNHTCYDNDSLKKIAKNINSKKKANIKVPEKIDDQSRKKLWENIKKNLSFKDKCSDDYCIANTSIVKEAVSPKQLEETFRPVKPESWNLNERKWLSTLDIRPVMKQYEKTDKTFKFIGPVPVDFDSQTFFGTCVSDELCKIEVKNLLKNNKKKLGVVFNLDPHYKSGSHWTAMYTNFKNGGIYYFDSYGVLPPHEIQRLMLRLKNQSNLLIQSGTIDINKLDDSHTVTSSYEIVDSTKIKVDNPDNFLYQNLIFFGKMPENPTKKSKLKLDKKTLNYITQKNGKILTLKNPIDKAKLKNLNVVSMKSFRTFYNNKKFQFKNTECGVYSMYFIDELLHDKTYDEFISNIIKDDAMHKNRQKYFRPNSEEI